MSKKLILNIGLCFCLVFISIFFVACVSIKNPELIDLENIDLVDTESDNIVLNIDFSLHNPNWFNIKANDIDFNIYVDTIHLASGKVTDEVVILKNDTSVVSSDVTIKDLVFPRDFHLRDSLIADIYGSAKVSLYPKKYHFNFKQKFSISDFTKPLTKDFISDGSIEVKSLKLKNVSFSDITMEMILDFYNKSKIGYEIKKMEIEIFQDKNYKNKIGESSIDETIYISKNKTTEIVSEIKLDLLSSGFSWLKGKIKKENHVYVKVKASVDYNNMIFPFSVKKKIEYNDGDFEID